MAWPESCSAANRSRFPRGPPAAAAGPEIPFDLMLDVLLRVPAKDLCRLRAVCRSWRAATSDPLFVRSHAARHPDPLILANPRDDDGHIRVMDLSGAVVKRIAIPEGHRLLCTHLDLACVATDSSSCCVLNPATRTARVLPECPTSEHADHENLHRLYTLYAFGRVPSTGEYKVLRIFNRPEFTDIHKEQLFEVFTVNGEGDGRWRAKQPRHVFVEATSAVVVDGAVYFKIDSVYHAMMVAEVNPGLNQDSIFSFNLETEEWRGELRGPLGDNFENLDDFDDLRAFWPQMTLADLRGSLALVHYRKHREVMDLWLLEDFEEGIWVKKYSIQTESKIPSCCHALKSLFELDDGRLVMHFERTGLLLIYDPRLNTSVKVVMKHLDAVAMYTGSPLCLQAADMV